MWAQASVSVSRAAVTKCHKLGDLTEIYRLAVLEAIGLKSGCEQGYALPEALGESPPSSFWCLQAFLDPLASSCSTAAPASAVTWLLSPCLSESLLFS